MKDVTMKMESNPNLGAVPAPMASMCSTAKKAHELVKNAIVNVNYINGTLFGFPPINDDVVKEPQIDCLSDELDATCSDLSYLCEVLSNIKERL